MTRPFRPCDDCTRGSCLTIKECARGKQRIAPRYRPRDRVRNWLRFKALDCRLHPEHLLIAAIVALAWIIALHGGVWEWECIGCAR